MISVHSCHLFCDIQFTLFRGPNIPGPVQYCSCSIRLQFYHQIQPQWVSFPLWLSPFILSAGISPRSPSKQYWAPADLGVHLSVSCLSAFSYCSRGSRGKNTNVVFHCLLPWTTFSQNSPPESSTSPVNPKQKQMTVFILTLCYSGENCCICESLILLLQPYPLKIIL